MASSGPPRLVSPWDLAALGGLVALACLYLAVLPVLPDPVPVHFDAMGRANGWAPRAQLPWLLFGAPVFLWLVLFLIGAAASKLPGGRQAMAIDPLRGMLGLGLSLLMAGCLLVPLLGSTALFAGLLALAACLLTGMVFVVRNTWQVLAQAPRSEHYRLGVFYVNPQDPRLWVPKRLGLGWTLNYARPAAAWVTLLILAAIPAVILAALALARK
ncbi:MAG: DUF5808 domain-containing protein [Holophaga sp.]|nr:DUF5808 domain-containing protein [Holophaga sp.]